jgi:hypothetical protein
MNLRVVMSLAAIALSAVAVLFSIKAAALNRETMRILSDVNKLKVERQAK